MEVTLTLPDDLLARVGAIAERSGRKLEEVLSETLSSSFSGGQSTISTPWAERSDSEVLEWCEAHLDAGEDDALCELLTKQREGELTSPDRTRLAVLMRRYEDVLLLKAEALREAVSRGLKPPLNS